MKLFQPQVQLIRRNHVDAPDSYFLHAVTFCDRTSYRASGHAPLPAALDENGDYVVEEAKMVMDRMQGEEMATNRYDLLAQVNGRYGKGKEFLENYRDARLKEQEKLCKAAPQANALWMADTATTPKLKKACKKSSKPCRIPQR